jgi:hypothetical protein
MISGLFPTLPEDNAPDSRPDFIVELISKKEGLWRCFRLDALSQPGII